MKKNSIKRKRELQFTTMNEITMWVKWIKKQFSFKSFKERVFNLGNKLCLSIEYNF